MYQSTIASSSGVGVLRDVTSRVRLITLLLYAHIRYRAGDLRWRFLNDWVEVAFLHLGRRRNRNFIMQITKPQSLVAIPNCKCGSKSSRSVQHAIKSRRALAASYHFPGSSRDARCVGALNRPSIKWATKSKGIASLYGYKRTRECDFCAVPITSKYQY